MKKQQTNSVLKNVIKIASGLAIDASKLVSAHDWRERVFWLLGQLERAEESEKDGLLIEALQCIRNAGAMPFEQFVCSFFRIIEGMSLDADGYDPELIAINAKLDTIKKREGLTEDESWYADEGPEDWKELNRQWERRSDEIEVELMRSFGEGELADLYLNNQAEFMRLHEAGRRVIFNDPDGQKASG